MVIGDLIVLVLIATAAVAVVIAVSSNRAPAWSESVWVAEHLTRDNRTVVVVARKLTGPDHRPSEVAERREIGSVANDDPGYEHALLDLLETAANRAALLNSTPNG